MRDRLAPQGVEPVGGTPGAFTKRIDADLVKWTKVAKDSGARVN